VCSVACDSGYDLIGSTDLGCVFFDWKWTLGAPPKCSPRDCMETPDLMFGVAMDSCAGRRHGDICEPVCLPGYALAGEGTMQCSAGKWLVSSACLEANLLTSDVETEQLDVIQTSFAVDPGTAEPVVGSSSVVLDYAWSVANEDVLADAMAKAVGVSTASVQLEIVPISEFIGLSRRLEGKRKLQVASGMVAHGFSANAFGIKAIIVVEPQMSLQSAGSVGSDTDHGSLDLGVEAKIKRLEEVLSGAVEVVLLPDGTSSSICVFASYVSQELHDRGLPLPVGLDSTVVEQKSPVVNVNNFTLPVARYVAADWSACFVGDEKGEQQHCGTGTQNRTLKCSRGKSTGACAHAEELLTERACGEQCPMHFNILCPMGSDGAPAPEACGAQSVAAMGCMAVALVLLLYCCAKLFVWRRRKLRQTSRPHIGVANIAISRKHSTQSVVEWNKECMHAIVNMDRFEEDYKGPCSPKSQDHITPCSPIMKTCSPSTDKSKSQRSHKSQLSQLTDISVNLADFDEHVDVDLGMREMSVLRSLCDRRDAECQDDANLFVRQGETVECWRSKKWVTATVELVSQRVPEDEAEGGSDTPHFQYCLQVEGEGQILSDMPIDAFREPFQYVQLVQVFSKRGKGSWLNGAIAGSSNHGGYRVYVEDLEMYLDNVSPVRLRSRFPASCAVWVYRGPLRGWIPAVVHSIAAAQPPAPEALDVPPPISQENSPGGCTMDLGQLMRNTSGDDQTTPRDDPMHQPWQYVPIVEEETARAYWHDYGQEAEPQWTPSYLLRSQVITRMPQAEEVQRRQFFLS